MVRKGISYWEADSWYDNHDYVIIGSGIVGLTTALYLREAFQSARILIVDRGHLPTGGSTKNAGFLCFGSVGELIANINLHNEDQVIQIIKRRIEGLNLLREITEGEDIGYKNCGGYEVSTSQAEMDNLCKHLPYLNDLIYEHFGSTDTFSLTNHTIGELAGTQIFNQYEGSIHTGKLISTLIRKCYAHKIAFLQSTEVESFETDQDKQVLQTNRGGITSENIICCTNAFTDQLVSDVDIQPQRNQVILTSPLDHNLPESCFHCDEGYLYFRPIGKKLLIGGARNRFASAEATDSFGNTTELTEYLRRWVSTNLVPNQPIDIEMQWSGILGTGADLHPIVQQVRPSVYVAARMNGMGVAIGTKVGKDVVNLIISEKEANN
jgi:glycine/D-amino acid oxidase-like deaminating enzyme